MVSASNRFNGKSETEKAKLALFVVCEDHAAEIRAKIFFERLSTYLGSLASFEINLWRLNLLRTPLLRERAAVEAGQAQAIIVSLDHRTGIPQDMEEWIGRWLGHKEDRAYLMGVLLEEDLAEADFSSLQLDFMRETAKRAGTAFFCWDAQNECDLLGTMAKLAKLRDLQARVASELNAVSSP